MKPGPAFRVDFGIHRASPGAQLRIERADRSRRDPRFPSAEACEHGGMTFAGSRGIPGRFNPLDRYRAHPAVCRQTQGESASRAPPEHADTILPDAGLRADEGQRRPDVLLGLAIGAARRARRKPAVQVDRGDKIAAAASPSASSIAVAVTPRPSGINNIAGNGGCPAGLNKTPSAA